MVIPIGAIRRLIRWIFTDPLGALRFFLLLAIILLVFWSFFNTTFAYVDAAESNTATLSEHILFYMVGIIGLAVLLGLPFLLQFSDRIFHRSPADPAPGCLILLGILAIPFLALWILIGVHPKVAADIEGTVMGSLLFLALGASALLLVRERRKNHRLNRFAEGMNSMGKRPLRS